MTLFRHAIISVALTGIAGAAQAGLEICNETEFLQSVSIGYQGEAGWKSEGWWNIEPGDCAVVVGGDLPNRYYYYRAEVDGADVPGDFDFCTTPQVYEIIGDTDCEARGYDTEAFIEIDTGESATDYTFTLRGSGTPPPRKDFETSGGGVSGPAESGLEFCNSTPDVQSVAIGYENDQGFLSEGWWNIEPNDCALVLAGELERRYYYWRAEVEAADFPGGEGYMFCTDPDVFSIQGDDNCEARGYARESFAEIDTGATATGYVFYIGGQAAPPPVDPPATGNAGLEVCNETEDTQSVVFGYEGPDDWTSEGWWNVEPGECTIPTLDGVNRRYIYYRAEVDGGDFEGQNYFFCTTPEAFKVVGDANCEARGYDREEFREVDTGSTTDHYVLTLVDDSVPPPPVSTMPKPPRNDGSKPKPGPTTTLPDVPDLPTGKGAPAPGPVYDATQEDDYGSLDPSLLAPIGRFGLAPRGVSGG